MKSYVHKPGNTAKTVGSHQKPGEGQGTDPASDPHSHGRTCPADILLWDLSSITVKEYISVACSSLSREFQETHSKNLGGLTSLALAECTLRAQFILLLCISYTALQFDPFGKSNATLVCSSLSGNVTVIIMLLFFYSSNNLVFCWVW